MKKQAEISNIEWILVIGFAMMVDVFQFILNVFTLGVVANRFIDVAMGLSIATYFLLRGVKITKGKMFSFVGTFLGELAPILDSLPLWSLYLFATMLLDKAEKKAEKLLNSNKVADENTEVGDTSKFKKAA